MYGYNQNNISKFFLGTRIWYLAYSIIFNDGFINEAPVTKSSSKVIQNYTILHPTTLKTVKAYTVKIMILSRYRYHPVTVPLPSRYHFQVIVTHGDTPSVIVTLPFLTVPHRPHRTWSLHQGRWWTVRDGVGEEETREREETLAKNGNGTVTGKNHNFYCIISPRDCHRIFWKLKTFNFKNWWF